jgi:hypothetical protein
VLLKGWDHEEASPASKAFGNEIKAKGLDHVEMRVVFPPNYPTEPPFVYVRKPRIKGSHVFDAGAMCMDVLMPHGWTPATSTGALMRTIRSCFEGSIKTQVDWLTGSGEVRENLEHLARKSFSVVESAHSNWKEATPQESGSVGKRRRE